MKIGTAYKISLFIVAVLGVLAAICLLWPTKGVTIGGNTLQWPTMQEVLGPGDSSAIAIEEAVEVVDSAELAVAFQTEEAPTPIDTPATPKPKAALTEMVLSDTLPPAPDTLTLSRLAAALQEADSRPVRIVYYGDSQIEGDRMTMIVRRALQKAYGGGGVGLLPLHQTIGSRTITQSLTISGELQNTNGGPQRYLAYGPKSARRDTTTYGPMAQVAVMDSTLVAGSEHAIWRAVAPKKKHSESYFNRVRVLADNTINISVANGKRQERGLYALPDSSTEATIRLDGQGDVYGISLETDHGVTVDNIPMRGCAGTIFTGINSEELIDYYQATNTRLIIMQYGGNVVPYTNKREQVLSYVRRIRQQIRFIRRCAPEADIVFVGPSDMVDKNAAEVKTHPAVPAMDKALRQMCKEENILYFSLFNAMGGAGSMKHWHANGWAGSDLVHFTRQGADKAGSLLADWIIDRL